MRFVFAPLIAAAAFFAGLASAEATVQVHIDLAAQSMHVTSGHADYDWAVSTGRPGYRTPTGVYRPQRMYVMTHSNKYDNAPMPHAIFFSGGYAIHATYATGALGHVASHGCVRLSPGNAAALYEMVRREGATIVISGVAPGREEPVAERERLRAGGQEAMAFAPHRGHRVRSIGDWANNPLENQ